MMCLGDTGMSIAQPSPETHQLADVDMGGVKGVLLTLDRIRHTRTSLITELCRPQGAIRVP